MLDPLRFPFEAALSVFLSVTVILDDVQMMSVESEMECKCYSNLTEYTNNSDDMDDLTPGFETVSLLSECFRCKVKDASDENTSAMHFLYNIK